MLCASLRDREAGGRHGLQAASQCPADRLPAVWKEQDVTKQLTSGMPGDAVDKAFAAAWQDDQHLLVGTKCNRLLQWDTTGGTLRDIPLPPAPARERPPLDTMWGSCGIHSVAVNPAGDMVATNGAEPADCCVLTLPDFRPVQTLVGHLDWVFGAAWVSDRHVVTASRDSLVALWSLPDPGAEGAPAAQCQSPAEPGCTGLLRKFEGRVRDVKYDFDSGRLAALSTEGCVKLLDPGRGLRTVRTIKLAHTKELVCLEQRADMLAMGSVGHVTTCDPRRRNAELAHVASPDDNQGVRSVQLSGHLLSFGTGRGKLFFWDLRRGAFLPTETAAFDYGGEGVPHCKLSPALPPAWAPRQHIQLGDGVVARNELYFEHFAGLEIQHACYAHLWDTSRTRLFACGGPLAFGLQGCYLGVWH